MSFTPAADTAAEVGLPVTVKTPPPPVSAGRSPTPHALPEINLTVDRLPSQGKAYPPGATISYRPYTFGEIKRINQSNMTTRASLEEVLSGVTTSFPREDLTLADALYLGVLRKISTLGTTKIMIPYICSHCRKPTKHVQNSDALEFDDLAAPALPVYADLAAGEFGFMPVTVAGYFSMIEKGVEDDELALLAQECMSADYDKSLAAFTNAPAQDGQVLEEVDKALYHSLKPILVKCEHCQGPIKLELDGGQSLILPFREPGEPSRSRVRFGPRTAR